MKPVKMVFKNSEITIHYPEQIKDLERRGWKIAASKNSATVKPKPSKSTKPIEEE